MSRGLISRKDAESLMAKYGVTQLTPLQKKAYQGEPPDVQEKLL